MLITDKQNDPYIALCFACAKKSGDLKPLAKKSNSLLCKELVKVG